MPYGRRRITRHRVRRPAPRYTRTRRAVRSRVSVRRRVYRRRR